MGLPPTSSKFSGDATNLTTFNYQFPNITATHSGITAIAGISSVAGGGTGLATLTANNVILGNGASSPTFVAPGTVGNVLYSNGTTWTSNSLSGSAAYVLYTSSQVTTQCTGVTSSSYTTISNSPALTFTPTITGTYKVYSSIPLENSSANSNTTSQIFNTTGGATLLSNSIGVTYALATAPITSAYTQATYTLTAGTSYVFDIQIAAGGGTSSVRGDIAPFYMYAEGVGLTSSSTLSLGAFGSTPNADGLSLSAGVLNMQPASGSFPGGVSTTTQTFAGSKTIGFNAADVITIGAASSTALHQTNGGMQLTTRTVTASTFTVDTTTTDRIIYTDSTSNAITITLPAPTNGRILVIQDKTGKAATNNITINPHAAETINGLSTFVIAANYNSCELTSDGTNWLATNMPTSGNSFLTSGTTYTTPVNITPQTRFKFTLIGGGGGAGGINTAAASGAGGGAGAAVIVQATGFSANTGYTIAIGAAGTAGASTPTAGGNGGSTTINFLSSTYTADGGTGANDTATSNGGAGGAATSTAGTGVSNIINMAGGGGGSASGVTTNGSGQGGSGFMGWGGQAVIAAGGGNAGTGFGGGGSGGKGVAAAGGAGAAGCIVVEWWN